MFISHKSKTEERKKMYLKILLGDPVRVVDDAGVSCCQVNAKPPSPRRKQEHLKGSSEQAAS